MHQTYLYLCSEDEQRSYGFGTTWGWVINDRIFIFGWSNLLTSMETFLWIKGSLEWKKLLWINKKFFKLRKLWFFHKLFTERFFGDPKMMLLWHCSKNSFLEPSFTTKINEGSIQLVQSVVFSWICLIQFTKQIWKNQIDPDLKLNLVT